MIIMDDTPLEICRKFISITKIEETFCEWCDTYIAVRTQKGIHFYEFSHNLECVDKRLDCVASFVSTPPFSPSENIYNCSLVKHGLKNKDISEMMLDPAMWGHSEHLVQEMSNVAMFQFSPQGLVQSKHKAIAILNNIGHIELYTRGRHEWKSVLNISSCIKDQLKQCLEAKPSTFSDLKNMAYNLATSAFCWGPQSNNGYCYLATCQKSNVLLFWLIQPNQQENDLTAVYCGKIDVALDEIVCMRWIPKSENKLLLFCSCVSGQVMMLECQINKKHVILLKSHILWEHQDRMLVRFIEFHIQDNKILLFYNKHRHLVSQLLDENCRIISQSIDNINDYRLTSLAKFKNQYYLTTINFNLYEIQYSIQKNILKVTFKLFELKDISPTMELFSARFSHNGAMCALTTHDRRIMHKKDPMHMDIIFIQAAPDNTIWEILLNNPTRKLTEYWDCIELLRFKIVKQKALPAVDLKTLRSEAESDPYKLKLYFVILTIYRSQVKNIKISSGNVDLPEKSLEPIKDKILALQATENIKTLFSKTKTKSLTEFEQECFVGSKKYLIDYSKRYERKLADLITPEMFDSLDCTKEYTCQCCDAQIDLFSCPNGHPNMFCSLTFTPIETLDYVSCKYCNAVARSELYSEKPLCVYCDSYLENDNFCV